MRTALVLAGGNFPPGRLYNRRWQEARRRSWSEETASGGAIKMSGQMLRLAGIITAIGISTSVPADASTIFSETFDNLTPGAQLVALPYSQRAAGTYYLINSLPGWSAIGMASGVYAFEYGTANYALLLN